MTDLKRNGLPTGITLVKADDLREWLFDLEVLGESVFAGEKFRLRFIFNDRYPWEAPECTFVTTDGFAPPAHPHGACCS